MKKNKYLISFLLILLLVAAGFNKFYSQNQHTSNQKAVTHHTQTAIPEVKNKIPEKVITVLKYVELHGKPMDGYVGGREFMNREKRLPFFSRENKPIKYQEWDINPKTAGQNRGAERLVTGNDRSAWYTANHYKSFTQIK